MRNKLAAAGAVFRERWGGEVVARFTDPSVNSVNSVSLTEYRAVREAAALTDFSFTRRFRLPEDKALDFLDALLAGNVPKTRFGRVLHTFLANQEGFLAGDCYVANNDQEFIFLCESILPDPEMDALLAAAGAAQAGLEDLASSHVLLSVDGYKAWDVARTLFGADVLGLPYLSIENYTFEGEPVRLLRAGKTSEFGYLLLAPNRVSEALFDALHSEVKKQGGGLCGVDIHDDLRLEGRFFNIHREGARVRDPLVLGLQWMIDFDKDSFAGSEALKRRRAEGLRQKIIGVAAEPGCEALKEGAVIVCGAETVAEVVADAFSPLLERRLGLAVFPTALAYAGLEFRLGSAAGPVVRTISMPPILPKSLTVKLDEM